VTGLGDGKTSQLFQPNLRPLHQAIAGQKDDAILLVLEKGRGQMPGWENVLKLDQRKQLLDYMKTFEKKLGKTP
jgi:mono/diheme cytochrome c family protein